MDCKIKHTAAINVVEIDIGDLVICIDCKSDKIRIYLAFHIKSHSIYFKTKFNLLNIFIRL